MSDLVDALKNGCTVWGYTEAEKIRELQKLHPVWITIVTGEDLEYILGQKFDGTGKIPYFGAILTDEGRKHIDEIEQIFRQIEASA